MDTPSKRYAVLGRPARATLPFADGTLDGVDSAQVLGLFATGTWPAPLPEGFGTVTGVVGALDAVTGAVGPLESVTGAVGAVDRPKATVGFS